MEHLDLAGVLTTPPQWNLPVFEQQDALFLSSSRQMLEPIMEETSEDEECSLNSWHQYEQLGSDAEGATTEGESLCEASAGNGGASFWSSAESDTGSVIRIEVTKDNDSNSERDFLCPAKRPRRCEDSLVLPSNEEEVILRRPMYSDLKNNSLERFINYENFSRDSWGNNSQQRSSLGSRRGGGYDDFYSDSDSLSYNSLSRSSSLIQFESLERQLLMQEQHASMSSLGNSSPSLLSFDLQNNEESGNKNNNSSANNSANNSRRGSQSSLLKKYESLDGRLHQTYYDLDKLNFDDMHQTNTENFSRNCNLKLSTHLAELRSDSESSSEGSEGSLRPRSVLLNSEANESCQRTNALQSKKGKNSAENLSEDSGYCEPSMGFGLRRTKSQTLLKNYEKFSEEEEEMENKSLVYAGKQTFTEEHREQEHLQQQQQQQQHSNLNEFKNTTDRQEHNNNIKSSPPLSPHHLEFIRHKQRNETHSPSPVSSEVSTSSSHSSKSSSSTSSSSSSTSTTSSKCSAASSSSSSSSSSASSTSSATTCASKASFTWLMPTTSTSTSSSLIRATRVYEAEEESPTRLFKAADSQISINDPRLAETTNEENVENFRGKFKRNFIEQKSNNTENECLECRQLIEKEEHHFKESISDEKNACRKCGENIFNERRRCRSDLVNEFVLKCQKCQQNNAFIEENQNKSEIPIGIVENCQNCGENIVENLTQHFGERVRKKIIEQQLKLLNEKCCISGENKINSLKRNNLKENSPQSISNLKYSKNLEKNSAEDQSSYSSTPVTTRSSKHISLSYNTSSDSDYSPLSLRRNQYNLMPSWPIKTSSVPNDLNTIGRKKKHRKSKEFNTKTKTRDSSLSPNLAAAAAAATSNEDLSLVGLNIKRSSSWSFDNGCKEELLQEENTNLGILHQSYHNLAKLNLDSEDCRLNFSKMSEKRASSDYETEIVCKNNFLLDELSAHYDRTASILNDKPIEDLSQENHKTHNRRSSSASCSAGEEPESEEKEQIQHVQLVIRKPPARQKRNAKDEDKANSLTQDYSFSAIMNCGGVSSGSSQKTFDQDPTILKTSYAQSLEKCNFDCKELSTHDLSKTRSLPKRRFQSQATNAKKKSLVSSTPNLNAFDFDKQDDIEDDMFVSSAHTSMHQLNLGQNQKPLGILLPAGSRTSFGKEVSFCPVVSKYCWQEQSSEECNDNSEDLTAGGGDEESEDELLDNADATVIYNTKENENIASKYKEELLSQREQPHTESKEEQQVLKEKAVLKEFQAKQQVESVLIQNENTDSEQKQRENNLRAEPTNNRNETAQINEEFKEQESAVNNETEEQVVKQQQTLATTPSGGELLQANTISLTTNVNNETLKTPTDRAKNLEQSERVNNNNNVTTTTTTANTTNNSATTKPVVVVARPLSIQLPILSEPPINRAHHILYASQQMLDNFQRQQENEQYEHFKSQSTYNLSSPQKMSNSGKALTMDMQQQQQAAGNSKLNNNNEILKTKFKHEEKHPNSKGFLSRFANGFRFSLRRNKKKLQQQQKENQLSDDVAVSQQAKANSLPANTKQPDFIHIPLKGPLPAQRNGNTQTTNGNTLNGNAKNTTVVLKQKGAKITTTTTAATNDKQKVTGKPPIPPQQQQQLQLMQKMQSAQSSQQQQQQQQQPLVEVGLSRFYTETNNTTAHNPRSSTQDFLNTERFYNQQQQQLNSTNSSQSCANNPQTTPLTNENVENIQENCENSVNMTAVNTNNTAASYDFSASSPSRASVSQKTQMFNNLSRPLKDQQPKIGLIETNLDTHETIITGKTRSLINIAPHHQQQQSRYAGNKRIHHNNITNRHHYQHQHGIIGGGDDEGYDDDDNDDEVIVRPDGTVVVIKNAGTTDNNTSSSASQAAQIASVRRPHKSMEFLLDKENQKDVMPPENELQKSHDHNPAALSEHQLRIQASLQRLNIPDWFRQYNQNQKSPEGAGTGATSVYKPGNFTRKRTQDSGRWVGLNSKTTSLSSLGSQRSDRSPLLLSPSAHSHHGGQSMQHAHGVHGVVSGTGADTGTTATGGAAFSRWSTSHLNSSQTSPSVSQRGSFSRGGPINSSFISVNSGHSVIRNSMRQPYLGWRSQEKLSQRTAHERLASSLLSQQQQRTSPTTQTLTATTTNDTKLQPVTPEIQTSIKEVTSAIVHYVNDQTNQQRSRSTSPNSRKCWLESSFVGIRPLDSPQTPIIENTPLIAAAAQAAGIDALTTTSTLRPLLNNNNNNINFNNYNLQYANHNNIVLEGGRHLNLSTFTGNDIQLNRMNGGLNNGTSSSSAAAAATAAASGGINIGVGGVLVSESTVQTPPNKQDQQQQQHMPQKPLQLHQEQQQQQKENLQLLVISKEEQQRLRRRSEGDAATKQKQQQQQLQQQQQQQRQEQQQQQFEQKSQQIVTNAKTYASDTITSVTNTNTTANGHAGGGATTFLPPRRVSLGDSSESNNRTASASGELQIKCRNNKCDRTATPADAKKYYKSCHNCTYLYCSRECRRAHWEKHRKACLHSRVSNLCRQVLASCKDDSDSLRHLSLLARKGFLSQGRGVVRILFRSPEAAEGFIKNGFQCMGEASYVRWPDLMPAEMGLELYSELLKLSTEYRPDSKMLVYVAVCVVSEAPGMGQAPVRWERQLVSRCAKLKLCKTVLAELEQQQTFLPQPVTVVAVPEPTTEVLILTFNPQLRSSTAQREMVLSNILAILSRRGVILRKHYPEIFQRLQNYTEGQTDKFNPVTLHPRDSHTGQNFVCIIMPVLSETEIIKLPSIADGGNRVTSIDVGSTAALAKLDDDELLTRTTTVTS